MAEDIKPDQRNGTKMQLKLSSTGAKSDHGSWRSMLPTDRVGVPFFIKSVKAWKKLDVKKSILKENSDTGIGQ